MNTTNQTLVVSYADALFQAAKKAGKLDLIAEQAVEVSGLVAKNAKLRSFYETPSISIEDKEGLFVRVFGKDIEPLLTNFVRMIIRRGRLMIFFAALDKFSELYQADKGFARATIESAVPIAADQQKTLLTALERLTGKQLVVTWKVDAELLGGIRFSCGDTLIDSTIRRGLDQLNTKMNAVRVY